MIWSGVTEKLQTQCDGDFEVGFEAPISKHRGIVVPEYGVLTSNFYSESGAGNGGSGQLTASGIFISSPSSEAPLTSSSVVSSTPRVVCGTSNSLRGTLSPEALHQPPASSARWVMHCTLKPPHHELCVAPSTSQATNTVFAPAKSR